MLGLDVIVELNLTLYASKLYSTLHADRMGALQYCIPGLYTQSSSRLTTFKVRHTATPDYLSNLLQTHAPAQSLQSSEAPTMVVPRTNIDLARRAFSVAAPAIWNSLPNTIRLCESNATFNPHLKTFTFI